MNRFEYLAATLFLRILRLAFSRLPVRRDRVVLASARHPRLEGNLRHVNAVMRRRHPDLRYVLLMEPYSYRFGAKLIYLLRMGRAMYFLCTSRLFIVDNAYLPIHVGPHRAETTVVQVWHAAGSLKHFGLDAPSRRRRTERAFLHRYYDYVIVAGEAGRAAYASALRTPVERVLALGSPRTDFFFDPDAMASARARVLRAYPMLSGKRVVLYAPTFRGRGPRKRAAPGIDAARLRSLLPDDHVLVLKTHPNLDPHATPTDGYDVVIDPGTEVNDVFTLADVLVTDYSSSIFEWALLRRPLILLVPDLKQYRSNPGLYLDYRTDMIGTQVSDTDAVAAAILDDTFDASEYAAFVERHLGASDGSASVRFVERFLSGDTLPSHVSHD
ncbi:MAG: CDP-glycerol glycerophosphotransferase family protein [Thermoleophilaceae bacterium]|nr:CDP-glycerol glycerophosphotransferase family protein [Thermoleophilaceae bacterium]